MAPKAPSRTPKARHHQEADTPKKARFFHAINQARESEKTVAKKLKEEHVNRDTEYRWLRQRSDINARRAGKTRTERSKKITEEELQIVIDSSNPVRDQPKECQLESYRFPYCVRTLTRACKVHKPPIIMRKQLQVRKIFDKNLKERVEYGKEHKNHIIENF